MSSIPHLKFMSVLDLFSCFVIQIYSIFLYELNYPMFLVTKLSQIATMACHALDQIIGLAFMIFPNVKRVVIDNYEC